MMRIVDAKPNRAKTPLVFKAYELMKEKIVTLEFSPGMKLEEKDLIERLKMGRTPIREAVKMLISEGLIVSYGSNATYVKEFTLKSARDLLSLIYHLGDVVFNMTNVSDNLDSTINDLEVIYRQMENSINQGDVLSFVRLNAEFHKTNAKIANNEYLDDILERLYYENVRLAFVISSHTLMETSIAKYYDKVQEQHRELIDLLKHRDFQGLKRAYKVHLELGQQRLFMFFAEKDKQGQSYLT
jgi:DNA-binding GntR family transcriptional regulator